ncbi:MAG: M20/M25/M40 family metallo-hydrolase, partial [Gemmatimonadetes bacterium]|nr:M20/M25/M40 family metallo-hydrolase [Gemmatimonadota bacterium]
DGERRYRLLESWTALDSLPPERRVRAPNVVGIIAGSDPALRNEAIVVAAHYDHLGVGRPLNGDSIYNGADDDATGVATVLAIARELSQGSPPKRTVVVLLTTGEEVGLLGTRWYIAHPRVPLARTVAEFEVEMVGRPDPLVQGAGRAWLTGYERSTMGERLAADGVPIVADPRPTQQFFQRSDNIAFACRGIPAHTLSTFGLHQDYHTPDDEVDRIDFPHMARVVDSAISAVRLLAEGPAPTWKPGGSPVGDAAVCGRF